MLRQILPSIYTFSRLVIGRVYLVEDPDGFTLIDTGHALSIRPIRRAIEQAGRSMTEINRIVITHAHPDHASNLPQLKAETGAELYASAGEKDIIEGNKAMESINQDRFPFLYRLSPPMYLSKCTLEHPVKDGDWLPVLNGLHAISTPGHTSGHMSYWHAERGILFAGDAIIRLPRTQRPLAIFTQNETETTRSIQKIDALKPKALLPGHGQPILHDTAAHIHRFAQQQAGNFGLN